MDPRYQPQHNHPYPQNPQNNADYPKPGPSYAPEAYSDPNNYPTPPSVQNHQKPQYGHGPGIYPPQENYAPHLYPQYNRNFGGHPGYAGYVPPRQYGNIQDGPIYDGDGEKGRLNSEMKELEKRLESCHLQCYAFWSCIFAVVAFLGFLWHLFSFMSSNRKVDVALILLGFSWLIGQSYFAFASIQSRSVTKATVAFWMMVITLIPSLIGEQIAVTIFVNARGDIDKNAGLFLTIFVSLHLAVHLFLNMFGAFQVRKILMERAKVEARLAENSFNNYV